MPYSDLEAKASLEPVHLKSVSEGEGSPVVAPKCHSCQCNLPSPVECARCAIKTLDSTEDIKADMWLHDGSEHPVFRFKAECIARLKELDRRLLDYKVCHALSGISFLVPDLCRAILNLNVIFFPLFNFIRHIWI